MKRRKIIAAVPFLLLSRKSADAAFLQHRRKAFQDPGGGEYVLQDDNKDSGVGAYDGIYQIGHQSGSTRVASKIPAAGAAYTLTRFEAVLHRVGSPAHNWYGQVFRHDGGTDYPDGDENTAAGTSINQYASSEIAPDAATPQERPYYAFDFSPGITISAGETFWVSVVSDEAGTISLSDYVAWTRWAQGIGGDRTISQLRDGGYPWTNVSNSRQLYCRTYSGG